MCIYSREIRQHLVSSNRRRIRNPNGQEYNDGNVLIFTGQEEKHDDNTFVPVEIKAGIIVGYYFIVYLAHKILFQVMPFSFMVMSCTRVHKVGNIKYDQFSVTHLIDKSSVSRLIYAVHLMEMHNSIYCKENW